MSLEIGGNEVTAEEPIDELCRYSVKDTGFTRYGDLPLDLRKAQDLPGQHQLSNHVNPGAFFEDTASALGDFVNQVGCFSRVNLGASSLNCPRATVEQPVAVHEDVYSFSDLLKINVSGRILSHASDVFLSDDAVPRTVGSCNCPSDEETDISDCDSDLNGSLRLTEEDFVSCAFCHRKSVITTRKRKRRSQSRRKTEYNDNYIRKQRHFIDSFLPEIDDAFPFWEDWLKPEKANVSESVMEEGNLVRRKQCTCDSFCRHFYEIMFSRALSTDKVYDGMKEPAFFGLQQETVFAQMNFIGPGQLHHNYNPSRASHRIIRRKIEKKYGKHHRMPCASSSDVRCSAHRAIQAGERLGLIDVKYELAPKNWTKKNAKNQEANLANYARGASQIPRPSRKSTNNTLKAVCMVFLYHCTASIKGVDGDQIDKTRFGRIFNGQPERDVNKKYGSGYPRDERQRFNYRAKYEKLLHHLVKFPAPLIFCHQPPEVRQNFNTTFDDCFYDQTNADDMMWFTCPGFVQEFVKSWNRKQSYKKLSENAIAQKKPVVVYRVTSMGSHESGYEDVTESNERNNSDADEAVAPMDLSVNSSNPLCSSTCDVDLIHSLVETNDPVF